MRAQHDAAEQEAAESAARRLADVRDLRDQQGAGEEDQVPGDPGPGGVEHQAEGLSNPMVPPADTYEPRLGREGAGRRGRLESGSGRGIGIDGHGGNGNWLISHGAPSSFWLAKPGKA